MVFIGVRLSIYSKMLSQYKKCNGKVLLNANNVYSFMKIFNVTFKKLLRFGGIYENSSNLCKIQ